MRWIELNRLTNYWRAILQGTICNYADICVGYRYCVLGVRCRKCEFIQRFNLFIETQRHPDKLSNEKKKIPKTTQYQSADDDMLTPKMSRIIRIFSIKWWKINLFAWREGWGIVHGIWCRERTNTETPLLHNQIKIYFLCVWCVCAVWCCKYMALWRRCNFYWWKTFYCPFGWGDHPAWANCFKFTVRI